MAPRGALGGPCTRAVDGDDALGVSGARRLRRHRRECSGAAAARSAAREGAPDANAFTLRSGSAARPRRRAPPLIGLRTGSYPPPRRRRPPARSSTAAAATLRSSARAPRAPWRPRAAGALLSSAREQRSKLSDLIDEVDRPAWHGRALERPPHEEAAARTTRTASPHGHWARCARAAVGAGERLVRQGAAGPLAAGRRRAGGDQARVARHVARRRGRRPQRAARAAAARGFPAFRHGGKQRVEGEPSEVLAMELLGPSVDERWWGVVVRRGAAERGAACSASQRLEVLECLQRLHAVGYTHGATSSRPTSAWVWTMRTPSRLATSARRRRGRATTRRTRRRRRRRCEGVRSSPRRKVKLRTGRAHRAVGRFGGALLRLALPPRRLAALGGA